MAARRFKLVVEYKPIPQITAMAIVATRIGPHIIVSRKSVTQAAGRARVLRPNASDQWRIRALEFLHLSIVGKNRMAI
jgi:hypothetical protein